jgi:hypothetical protein
MNVDLKFNCDHPRVDSANSLIIRHSHAQIDDLIKKLHSMNLHDVLEQMSLLYADIKLFKSELSEGMKEDHWCDLQRQVCLDKQLFKLFKQKLEVLKAPLLSKPASLHEVTEFECTVPVGHQSVVDQTEESFRVFSPCTFEKVKNDLEQFEKKVKAHGDGSSHDEIDLPLASNTETPADSP